MNQFTQLLRAAIEQHPGLLHAGTGDIQPGSQARVGRCVCGAPVAAHFGPQNQMLGCSHAQKVGQ